MIPHDVVYYRPGSIHEALQAFAQADAEGLEPAYVGGGTELVTGIRDGRAAPGALIDLRGVPETRGIGEDGAEIRYGACLSLGEVCEDERFPLLARAASGVADHSVRNTITLGGNVTGRLPYREAVLPFLVTAGRAEIRGPSGERLLSLESGFDRRLPLERGEILVALRVSRDGARAPWFHARRVKDGPVDYPLVALCAVRRDGRLAMAVSGVGDYPQLLDQVAGVKARSDHRAGAEYRRVLLDFAVAAAAAALEV